MDTKQDEVGGTAAHEKSDVDPKWVAIYGFAILAVLGIAAQLGSYALYRYFDVKETKPQASGPAEPPPPPRLQQYPVQDLENLRSREREALDHYGWVDRDQGIVRIPVDRAIDLIAQKQAGAKR